MATDFLFNTQTNVFLTFHDLVILAKAEGVTDDGRIAVYGTKARTDLGTPNDYHALEFNGGTNLYIGGADYSGEQVLPAYNIYLATSNSQNIGTKQFDTAAVHITENTTLHFNAQTGAKLASVNSDAKMRFYAGATTYWATQGSINSAYLPGPQQTTATTFQAGSNAIVIDGDLVGSAQAEVLSANLAGLHYYTSGSRICVDICNGNEFGATVYHAGTMTVENNITSTTELTALLNSNTVAAYNALTASGNTFYARGLAVDEKLTVLNGYFGGTISAVVGNTVVDAQPSNMYEPLVSSGSAGTANVVSNTVDAFGVSAGGTIQAAKLNGTISAVVSAVSMTASATHSSSTAANFSGNTIQAMAVHGGTVTMTDVDSTAQLSAVVSGVTASVGLTGGSKTLTLSDNTVNTRVIDAGAISLGDFHGTLTAATRAVRLGVTGYSGTPIVGNFYSLTAGMYAAETISVSGDLAGKINVTLANNIISGANIWATGALLGFVGAALWAETSITVNGQFTTNFALTVSASNNSMLFGVYTKTLTAAAYSGTLSGSAKVGLHFSKKAVSVYGADDAFDVNGKVSVSNYAFVSVEEVNLRVSNVLSGGIDAILSEHSYDASALDAIDHNTNTNDFVELTDDAQVTGDINLMRGYNTVVLNSGARMNGKLRADEGLLNIIFMLNENNADGEYAIVTTGAGDASLSSTASNISINLNGAQRNSSYELFDYGAAAVDAYWATKTVTFLFDGQSYVTTLSGGSATISLDVDDETVDVSIALSGGKVTVDIGGTGTGAIKDLPEFGAITGTLSDDGKLSLSWKTVKLGGSYAQTYEIEYQIYDAQGKKVGNSVGVTVKGGSSASQSFTLDHLSLNPGETVGYRMRAKSAADTFLTAWTTETKKKLAPVDPDLNEDLAMTPGTAHFTPFSIGDSVTTAVVKLSWDAATTDLPIKQYKVLYLESETELKIASWGYDKNGNPQATTTDGTVLSAYYKDATGTSVVASELINQSYVYWAVQAIDVAGNTSEFIDGTPFRSSVGDDAPPVVNSLTAEWQRSPSAGPYKLLYDITFSWDVTDVQSGVYEYFFEYKGPYDTQYIAVNYIAPDLENSYTLTEVSPGTYSYRIKAVDFAGNFCNFTTKSVTVGGEVIPTPVFPANAVSLTLAVDRSDAYAIKYDVTFDWKAATDVSGISQYILEYKLSDSSDWIKKTYSGTTLTATLKDLAGGLYDYRLSAKNNYGRVSDYATVSTFGSSNVLPPEGKFNSFSATVTADYTKPNQQQGSKVYTDVSVTFTWTGEFTSPAEIVYTVECSKSSTFTGNVYSFQTTDQTLTLAMGKTGLPVGVLSGMSKVYWRVTVGDSDGNVNPTPGATQSFKFVDNEGDVIKLDNTLAKPTDLEVTVNKSNATFRWNDGSPSGTYRYILSYTLNGKTTVIEDIASTSYTVSGLDSGLYTWQVSALAYSLKSTATAKGGEFAVDSVAPGSIKVKSVISVKTNAVIAWEPITTQNTGIKQYIVKYKSKNAPASDYITITTTDTAVLLCFNAAGSYSYQIYAEDNGGNISTATSGNFTIDTTADFGDALALATSVSVGTTRSNQTIGSDVDPADFITFDLKATSSVDINFSKIEDLIGAGSGLNVSVYDASGKKVGKSVTVKSEGGSGVLSTFLAAGKYYVGVTAKKKAVVTRYDVKVTNSAVPINNSDDTPAGAQKLTFSAGKAKSSYDWIGYSDVVDYYTFTVARSNTNGATAGNYNFQLADFTSKNAVVTIYRELSDGSIKKVKSFTATDEKPSLAVADLLEGKYYVAVSSKNAKNMVTAKNSYYTLHVTADQQYPQLSAANPTAVVNRNFYAEYKVSGSTTNAVLSFGATGGCSVYTDNGKGGFKSAKLTNGNLVASAGDLYYVRSNADGNQITVSETGYTAVTGKTLTLGIDSTGWLGGSSSESIWYFTGSKAETWVELGLNVVSSLGNTAKLKATLYTNVGGSWAAGPSTTFKSGEDKAMEFAAGAKTKYMLVVSGGSAKNAATYTIQSEQSKHNTNTTFSTAAKLSGTKEVSGKVVKDWDPVGVYDVSALGSGSFDWHMTDGAVKLSFYDASQNAVKVSAALTNAKEQTSYKTANVFTLNSGSTVSLSLDLSSTDVTYVMAEASGKNGNSYLIHTFAGSSASAVKGGFLA